jgi:hypothetical protein
MRTCPSQVMNRSPLPLGREGGARRRFHQRARAGLSPAEGLWTLRAHGPLRPAAGEGVACPFPAHNSRRRALGNDHAASSVSSGGLGTLFRYFWLRRVDPLTPKPLCRRGDSGENVETRSCSTLHERQTVWAPLGGRLQRQLTTSGNVEHNAKVLFQAAVGYNSHLLG